MQLHQKCLLPMAAVSRAPVRLVPMWTEFYNPTRPETCCGASEAKYLVKFVGTWTGTCHQDYYFSNAHWSPLTGVSHDYTYEVWNACMKNVSRGVKGYDNFGNLARLPRNQGKSLEIRKSSLTSEITICHKILFKIHVKS